MRGERRGCAHQSCSPRRPCEQGVRRYDQRRGGVRGALGHQHTRVKAGAGDGTDVHGRAGPLGSAGRGTVSVDVRVRVGVDVAVSARVVWQQHTGGTGGGKRGCQASICLWINGGSGVSRLRGNGDWGKRWERPWPTRPAVQI
jgi:hypothetical protein